MTDRMGLWSSTDGKRWFLLAEEQAFPAGAFKVQNLQGSEALIEANWLTPFEITEDHARRIAKDQLSETLDELKHVVDAKLADLRGQLEEKDRAPIRDDTTMTPNAAPALFDLLKQLPGVIGNSLSGEGERVDAAKTAMADLQRRLKDAGIDLDEHLTKFPDRLAGLRRDFAEQRAASKPTTNEAPSEKK
jgi:hypothetical protein